MADPKPQRDGRLVTDDEADELLAKAKAKLLAKAKATATPHQRKRAKHQLPEDWEVVPVEHDPLDGAVVEELKLRKEFSVAMKRGAKKEQKRICREWWRAMEILLERNAQAFRQSKSALTLLSKLAGYLAVGNIPAPIELARSRGGREPGPTERSHLGWGVAYLKAAEDGRINDTRHTKTVADCYGVNVRTVQKWRASIPPPKGSQKLSGDQIKQEMKLAARAYPGPSKRTMARRERE